MTFAHASVLPIHPAASVCQAAGRRRLLAPITERTPHGDADRVGGGGGGNGAPDILQQIARLARTRRGRVEDIGRIDHELQQLLAQLSEEERMQTLFAHWARTYDREMRGHARAVRDVVLKLRSSIRGAVVDLAAGTGLVATVVRRFAGVESVLLNDISAAMLETAKAKLTRYPRPLEFRNEDAASVSLSTSADTVLLAQTLHLVPDRKKREILLHAARMLRSGANFILVDEWPPQVPPVHDLRSALLESVFHPVELDELRRFVRDTDMLVEREMHIADIPELPGRRAHQMYGIRFERTEYNPPT